VFLQPDRTGYRWWPWLVPVLGYAVLGAFLMQSIDMIGLAQASLIAGFLGAAAVLCWRAPGRGLGWLSVGFLLRAILAVAEAFAYAWHLSPGDAGLPGYVGIFLASHSSFDTGAEWVIALGCVLALSHRTHAELVRSHVELGAAHVELQRVAERDPLTGLYNRRMLADLLARNGARGATLLFFDLDGFKRINDEDGHNVGDACLRRFAAALLEDLADAQGVLRFAGDEFLAILPPHAMADIASRIERIRQRLEAAESGLPALRFSVGVSTMVPDGDAQQALREADLAMYSDKARRRAVAA
jgi:diguanylate cyclase (GGDEF)-like protein